MEESVTPSAADTRGIDARLREALARFPAIHLALIFGSFATGRAGAASDVDVAVMADTPLSVEDRLALIAAIADYTGRAVDLVDLATVTEPLLGQIIRHGRRIVGSSSAHARLITRHLLDEADFMPYRRRILSERRAAWIGT